MSEDRGSGVTHRLLPRSALRSCVSLGSNQARERIASTFGRKGCYRNICRNIENPKTGFGKPEMRRPEAESEGRVRKPTSILQRFEGHTENYIDLAQKILRSRSRDFQMPGGSDVCLENTDAQEPRTVNPHCYPGMQTQRH